MIFTNLPSLHPLSFHEMIFILVSPVFASGELSLVMRMRNKKLPHLQDVPRPGRRAMAFHSDFRGGKP